MGAYSAAVCMYVDIVLFCWNPAAMRPACFFILWTWIGDDIPD